MIFLVAYLSSVDEEVGGGCEGGGDVGHVCEILHPGGPLQQPLLNLTYLRHLPHVDHCLDAVADKKHFSWCAIPVPA